MITSENTVQSPAKSKPADSVKDESSDCEDPNKDAGHSVPPRSEEVKSDGDCESTSGASNVPTVCSNEAKTDKDEDAKVEDEEIVSDKLPSLTPDEATSSTTSAAETECKEVAANSTDVSTEPGAIQAQTGSGGDNNASEVVCSSSQQNSPAASESEPQFDGTAVVEAAPMDSPPQKTMSETMDQSAVEGDMGASSPPRSVEDDFEGSDEDSLSDEDADIHVGRLRRRSSVSEEEEEVDDEDDDYEEDFTDEGDYSEEEFEDEEEEEEEGEEEEAAESELDNQAPTDDGQCEESTSKRAEELSPSAHTVTFSAAIDAAEKEGRIVDENKPDSREQKVTEEEEENKKNPAYVPRSGAYYMHDVRNDDSVSDGEGNAARNTTKRADRRPGIMADRWQHDRFDARLQAPPTEKELIYRYGYNIRKHGYDEVPDATPAAEATTTSDAPDVNTGFSSKPETSRPRRVPRKKIPQGRATRSSGSGGYRNVPVDSASSDPIQASAEQQPKLDMREAENTRSRGYRDGNRSDRGKDLEVYPSAPRSDNVRGSFTRSSTTENSCQVQGAASNQRTRTRQMDSYDEHRAPPRYNRGPDSRRGHPSEEDYERDDVNHIASRDETCRRPVDRPTDSRTPPGRDRREDRRHVQLSDVAHQNQYDRRTSHDSNYRAHPNNNRTVGPLRNQNYRRRISGGDDVNARTRGNAVLQSSTDRHMDYYDDYCALPSQHQSSDPRCDQRYAQRSYASTNFRDEPDDYQGYSGRRSNQPVRFDDEIRHGSGYRQDRHQPLAQASRGDCQPSDDRKSGYRPGRYGSRDQPSELKKPHRYSENSYRDYDHGSDLRPERYQPRAFTSEVIEPSGRIGYQDRSAGRGFNASGTGRHSGNRSSDFQSGRRFRHGRAEEQVQVPTQRAKRYSTIRQTPTSSGPSGQELEAGGHHRPPPQASPSPADRLPPPVTQKTIPPEPQSTVTTTSPPKPTVTPTPDSAPSTGQASNAASKASPSTTPGSSKDMQLLTSSMNAVRLGQPTHSVTYSPVGLGGSFPGPAGAQFAAGDPEMPPLDYYRSIDPALVAAVLNQQHALAQAVNNAALNGGPPLTPPHSLPTQAAPPPSSMGGFAMSPAGDAYYGVATMPVDARAIGQLYNVPPPLVGGAPPFRPELQPTSATTIPGGRPILGNRPKRSLEVKDPSSATLAGTTTPPSSSQVKAV